MIASVDIPPPITSPEEHAAALAEIEATMDNEMASPEWARFILLVDRVRLYEDALYAVEEATNHSGETGPLTGVCKLCGTYTGEEFTYGDNGCEYCITEESQQEVPT